MSQEFKVGDLFIITKPNRMVPVTGRIMKVARLDSPKTIKGKYLLDASDVDKIYGKYFGDHTTTLYLNISQIRKI